MSSCNLALVRLHIIFCKVSNCCKIYNEIQPETTKKPFEHFCVNLILKGDTLASGIKVNSLLNISAICSKSSYKNRGPVH